MSDPGKKRFQPLKFFACGGLISCVLIKEMQNSGIKWFQTSKFFACGGLMSCFLIKEVSDPGIERFQTSKLNIFRLWQAHIIRSNKGNARSWMKRF